MLKRKIRRKNANSTWCSQAVTHPSTNHAQRCLTAVIRREPVFSTWYGRWRKMNSVILNMNTAYLWYTPSFHISYHFYSLFFCVVMRFEAYILCTARHLNSHTHTHTHTASCFKTSRHVPLDIKRPDLEAYHSLPLLPFTYAFTLCTWTIYHVHL